MYKKRKFELLLLLPSLIGLSVFYIIPFLSSLRYAFIESSFRTEFVWFDNFISLFSSDYFCLALKNTLLFTVIAVPLIIVLSLFIALLILRFAARIPFVKNAYFLPFLLPSAAIVMIWQAYFAEIPLFSSLVVIYLWKYMGLNIMIILTALSGIDSGFIDAARIDGAGEFRISVSMLIPNISPAIFFTLILSFVNSLKIYRESYLLWGSYPDDNVYMLQNYLSNHFFKA